MVDRVPCRADRAPAAGTAPLPVVLVVVLSTPAWPAHRQHVVLEMVRELITWTYGTTQQ
ncbi:hypothetical protein ACVHNB_19820 [Streptomyces sp. YJ-C3]